MDKNIISCLQYTTLTSYLRLIFNDLLELKPDKHHENREGSWYVQMYSQISCKKKKKRKSKRPSCTQIGQV